MTERELNDDSVCTACNGSGHDPMFPECSCMCIHKELDSLDGQTIVLPNDMQVEIIKPNGDAFKAYQDAIDRADDAITKAIVGQCSMPIVEPIDCDKAWNDLVINGNTWPPKDEP